MTQAERVIKFFGGARALSKILTGLGHPRDPASIYRWTHPKSKRGTGGMVPGSAWPLLLRAAEAQGLELTAEIMDPRPTYDSIEDLL